MGRYMELTDIQKQEVAKWVADGMKLSDIQKRINDEFNIPMTFMEVRLLVIDIGAEYEEPEAPVTEEPEPLEDVDAAGTNTVADSEQSTEGDSAGDGMGVSVDVDAITRPGALVSGTVIFSDGVKAVWMLDQMGRIALDAGQPDYKPTETDLQLFQLKLREALQQKGF